MAKKEMFVNREISWLAFNSRVLQEAADPSVPLVNRMRFLGIFSNNQDEFYKVRVATLRRMANLGKKAKAIIGKSPSKVLKEIYKIISKQQEEFQHIYEDIIRQLEKKNVFLVDENKLSEEQGIFVKNYFLSNVRPVLVPLMLSKNKKFPSLNDKSLYLAVKFYNLRQKDGSEYALIEIPTDVLPRFIELPKRGPRKFLILLDDVIRFCLHDIFHFIRYEKAEAYAVKFTRDAELDIDNDVSKSFLEQISKSVKDRERGEPLRFVSDASIPDDLLEFLVDSLELSRGDNIIHGGRYHNFKDFMSFPNIGSKSLEYRKVEPVRHKLLNPYGSTLDVMASKDLLLHFPYQPHSHLIDLLREAAIDPKVKSIKIALYRVAKKSRVINALVNAARNGKSVTVVVELRARFDEEANIRWSNILQREGIKLVFGIPGLKMHSKIILIEREGKDKTDYFAGVGTGNFNEDTMGVFSDVILLTADKRITREVDRVFEFLETNYKTYTYKHLIVSPFTMRKKMIKYINNEMEAVAKGKEAYIFLKMNSLVDRVMIKKLYDAGMKGVKIKLIVRGICSLIPGVKGFSENIEGISIVDKYLEHTRIFVFCNGGNEKMFISSADWMTRNLDHRVEVTCPVYDESLKKEIRDFLQIQWDDAKKARIHNAEQDNRYRAVSARKKTASQNEFQNYLKELHG